MISVYQCADVTLISGFTVPSNVTCAASATASGTGAPSASGTTPASTPSTNAASRAQAGLGVGIVGFLAAMIL